MNIHNLHFGTGSLPGAQETHPNMRVQSKTGRCGSAHRVKHPEPSLYEVVPGDNTSGDVLGMGGQTYAPGGMSTQSVVMSRGGPQRSGKAVFGKKSTH